MVESVSSELRDTWDEFQRDQGGPFAEHDIACPVCFGAGAWTDGPTCLSGKCPPKAVRERIAAWRSSRDLDRKTVASVGQTDATATAVVPGAAKGAAKPKSEYQLFDLLRRHDEEGLEPVPVELGPLPPERNPTQVEAAKFIQLCFGLLLSEGNSEPMMFACSMLVDRGIVKTPSGASKIIRRFERCGTIWSPGLMEPMAYRSWWDGTKLILPGPDPKCDEPEFGWTYGETLALHEPPVAEGECGPVPVEAENPEGVSLEVLVPTPDQPEVSRAQGLGGPGGLDGVATAGNGAESHAGVTVDAMPGHSKTIDDEWQPVQPDNSGRPLVQTGTSAVPHVIGDRP